MCIDIDKNERLNDEKYFNNNILFIFTGERLLSLIISPRPSITFCQLDPNSFVKILSDYFEHMFPVPSYFELYLYY